MLFEIHSVVEDADNENRLVRGQIEYDMRLLANAP